MNDMTQTPSTATSKPKVPLKPRPRPQVMRLTDAAADRIRALTERADSEIIGLRVGIKNGGCAGQAYTVEYAHEIRPTDEVVQDKGVKILIDPKAVLFLLGTEMDYKADKMQAQFVFKNPNEVFRLRLWRIGAIEAGGSVRLRSVGQRPGAIGRSEGQGGMDREFLEDLFANFGPVAIRRMFSGYGISADGINFALVLRSGLYLRADETTIPQFEAAGSQPFHYETSARAVTVNSYWQVPAHLFDDSDEFAQWARAALAAAQRAALTKRARVRRALPAKRGKTAQASSIGQENPAKKKPAVKKRAVKAAAKRSKKASAKTTSSKTAKAGPTRDR